MKNILLTALALTMVAGCGGAPSHELPDGPIGLSLDVQEMVVPSDSMSGEPFLVSTDHGVALSWIDRDDAGASMRLARLDGASWGVQGTIASGDNWFVNWADVPSIEVSGQTMWAHWLEYNGSGRYAYGVRVATSHDGGNTWSDPTWLHDDTSAVEHGFAAMAVHEDQFHAVWLDGRKWAEDVQEMTVRSRRMGDTHGPEATIDARTCDCCPNDMVALGDDSGLIMAYRNRSETEVRDIYVARMVDGQWEEPVAVNDDGWEIAACPVNGPALAAQGQQVAIAWFTAPNGDPQVNVAFSNDRGATFGEPIRLDSGGAIGRVDLELLDDGTAIATWIQAQGGQSQQDQAGIIARRVAPDGRLSDPVTVVPTSASRASGYPRMVRDGNSLVFAWTATAPARRVMSARAAMSL